MKKYLLILCFLNQFFISYSFIPIIGDNDNSSLITALEEQRKAEEAVMRSEFVQSIKNNTIEQLNKKGVEFFQVISQDYEYEDGLLQLVLSADKDATDFFVQKIEGSKLFGFNWSQHLAKKNSNQMNALHYAILHGKWDQLKPLLAKAEKKWVCLSKCKNGTYRKHIDELFLVQDGNGNTPLHCVVAHLANSFKDEDVVTLQEVLSYCPKACAIKNNQGNSPVDYAAERQEIMDVFLKAAFTKNSIQ